MDFSDAIIAYSLPGTKEFLVGTVSKVTLAKNLDEADDYDFIISPFHSTESSKLLVKFSSVSANRVFATEAIEKSMGSSTDIASYNQGFHVIKDQIKEGVLKKAILSKVKFVENTTSNLYPLFINLKNKYKNAFTYLIKLPHTGVWMGASPELLMKKKDASIKTRAIAGTQSYDATQSTTDEVQWGDKEKEEHKIIERFLNQELKAKRIEHKISPTYTLAAGSVCHICSDINIRSSADYASVLDIIHPGPALSGFPKKKSIETIQQIEAHSRELYCGYLGPISADNCALYANIRCMKVFKNGYQLYLGGGITSDSNLEDEWQETEIKSSTLTTVIKNKLAKSSTYS